MNASLKMAVDQLVDYAGLFPPQSNDLAAAVDEYFRWVDGPHGWILRRFVCPARMLPELQGLLNQKRDRPEMPLSILGTGGKTLDEWETNLEQDAKNMTAFQEDLGESAEIEAIEIALPASGELGPVLRDLKAFESIEVFLELPLNSDLGSAFEQMADIEWVLAKARTGSIKAEEVPQASQVAQFLKHALDTEVPFKLTAGLHQPFAHWDSKVGADFLGFVNVLTAVASHLREDLSLAEWESILTDGDLNHWSVQPKGLAHRDNVFGWEELDDARSFFLSIGSCSLSEPVEGLEALSVREVVR